MHKTVIIIAGLVLLLIVIVAVISSVWPTQEERFIELGLLGKDKTANAYFFNENSDINVGILSSWFIYLHNHLGYAQNVSVRVKLLNSIMELPDDQENKPSNLTSFVAFPLSLSVNQSVLIPFSWSIMDAEAHNGSVVIDQLLVNDQPVNIDTLISMNHSFIMVFELWVQDNSSEEYVFGWESEKGLSSASVNMWFNVVIPSN
jgi:uncharacterized membrane protein